MSLRSIWKRRATRRVHALFVHDEVMLMDHEPWQAIEKILKAGRKLKLEKDFSWATPANFGRSYRSSKP